MDNINFPDIDEAIQDIEKVKRLLYATRTVLKATRREHKQLCELLDEHNIDYSHIFVRNSFVRIDSSGQLLID